MQTKYENNIAIINANSQNIENHLVEILLQNIVNTDNKLNIIINISDQEIDLGFFAIIIKIKNNYDNKIIIVNTNEANENLIKQHQFNKKLDITISEEEAREKIKEAT